MLAVTLAMTGEQTLVVSSNVNVSDDTTLQSPPHQVEMSLDVDPTNSLNLAGISFVQGRPEIEIFHSHDGGDSWSTTIIDDGALGIDDGYSALSRFDPSLAFDADGRLYVAYGVRAGVGGSEFTLVVGRSDDKGAAFSEFTAVDSAISMGGVPFLDKWIVTTGLDPHTGNQAVYVAYLEVVAQPPATIQIKLKVSGSNDYGESFISPTTINDDYLTAGNDYLFFPHPAVGPQGELYVSWSDLGATQQDEDDEEILIDLDADGLWAMEYGFGADVAVATLNTDLLRDAVPVAPTRGIHNGPVLDVDRSGGEFNGRVYLTWADSTGLPNSDIFLAYSDDRGGAWSSTGSVGNVEDSSYTDFLPWLDVDQTNGSVNIIYYSGTGSIVNGVESVQVRLASSNDGGETFRKATLSDQPTTPGSHSSDYLEYIGLAFMTGLLMACGPVHG